MILQLRARKAGWGLALALVGAFACATPAPLTRLEPFDPTGVVWVAGRASVSQERGAVRIATAFDRQEGRTLALRLEIENLSPSPFDVSPADVTYAPCTGPDGSACAAVAKVVDPEAMLATIDEQRAHEEAAAVNDQVLGSTLVLLSVASDVAEVGAGRSGKATGLRTAVAASSVRDDEAAHANTVSSLSAAKEVWANVAFRRSTLASGRGAAGLIFIPLHVEATTLRLYVRAGGQTFPFVFRQHVKKRPLPSNRSQDLR
jgi:hypothetical protein